MKTISCTELGGACDLKFHGSTFDQVAEQSQLHGDQMKAAGDAPHLAAMAEMMKIIEDGQVEAWLQAKMDMFALLPED